MAYYPREYLVFVEQILREYPDDRRALKDLELTIEACCRRSSIPVAGGGRTDASEPERITEAKLNNVEYQFLSNRIAKVKTALSKLSKEETGFIELLLWENAQAWEAVEILKIDERQVRRVKHRILYKVAPYVIGDWARVKG